SGHDDLLADPETATSWARTAAQRWAAAQGTAAPDLALSAADLRHLRDLRTAFELLVGGPTYGGPERDVPDAGGRPAIAAPVAATLVPHSGDVRLEPAGSGWRWLASALWIETYRSQQDGTWTRLKRCHNTRCGSTFYDLSRNN